MSRKLHAAALPFVSRALRGGRKLRYSAVALLLALLSVILGAWLALGDGPLEHELRVGFKLEHPRHVQELLRYKIFAEDEYDLHDLRAAADRLSDDATLLRIAEGRFEPSGYAEHRVHERMTEALSLVAHDPALLHAVDPALHDAWEALRARHGLPQRPFIRGYVAWTNDLLAEQLRTIIANDLRPELTLYRSPLTAADALRVIGLVAGAMMMLLLMLFAPVIAGTQMAQEVHDNTLQPLTGTALSARELVLGLSLGPAAVVALLAAPQLILFLAAALAVGQVLPALGLLAAALAASAFLTALAQLAGLALGRQRSPSMLAMALTGVLVPLTFAGALLALQLPARALGVLALLPQAAASHLLLESFIPAGTVMRANNVGPELLGDAMFAVLVNTAGMLCFAYLGLRALERRVGELAPSALSRGEALIGALVSAVLITIANPWTEARHRDPGEFYLINLGIALVPFSLLLMLRVPQAETPTALRRIPVAALLAEFAVGVLVFLAVSTACMGLEHLHVFTSPVALAYFAWTITVAGLLTIRVAALPMSLLAKIWAGVCVLALGVSFLHTAEWAHHPQSDASKILGFSTVSPLLGLIQAVMLVVIPVVLLRAIRHPATTAPRPD